MKTVYMGGGCGRRSRALLLLLAVGLGACAPAVQSYLHPQVDLRAVRRVAVLPFANLSGDEFAGDRLGSLLMTRLLAGELVDVAEPGAVREAMRTQRLTAGAALTPEQVVALGAALEVDGIFGGVVEEYGQVRGSREQLNQITVSFTLSETQQGLLIWRAQSHASSASFWRRLFGTSPRSLHELSAAAVGAALETLR